MSKLQTVTLKTQDLASYAVGKPCFICDRGNDDNHEQCRHCGAPLALTYQAEVKKQAIPKMLAMIGPAGCGKTVYLGMLTDILSRQQNSLQILARGAFSVALQQQTMALLARRRFPMITQQDPQHWNWMHCQIAGTTRRRWSEFILPDMSGAAMADEIEHGSSVVIRAFLSKCAGAIVMVDAEELQSGSQVPDYFGMKVITHLYELKQRNARSTHMPVAIVFTKADCAPQCLDDPEAYAEVHTPGLWRQCRERLKQHRFFATSVVGSSANIELDGQQVPVALRIEPRGVTDPLEWLIGRVS